ncbi:hypothetical protein FRC19_001885 [Serendipita sp. 401]|nr:hypothetical protein FRC19_001885 [Serendipita sp. 401]KAG8877005.1 hypothetical protein FRC20_000122 [Serendipita sp. 405]KAG9058028.1 hypothetical protein FS842_001989 [Serendipita sp. 407]
MNEWTRRGNGNRPDDAQWRFFALSLGLSAFFTLYLLYWNRLLAWIASSVFRLLTWDRSAPNSFWIEAESLHISVISGRIMFREFRYYSANQSIRAVKCYITWRYWLWRTRENEEADPSIPNGYANLPCRILISFEGLEWLLYNRTMVYDDILRQATAATATEPSNGDTSSDTTGFNLPPKHERSRWSPDTRFSNLPEDPQTNGHPTAAKQSPSPQWLHVALHKIKLLSKIWSWIKARIPTFDVNDLLPIAFEAKHGAIILGNPSMPTIFTIMFGSGDGNYSLKPARSRYDKYRQSYKLRFHRVSLNVSDNRDHRGSMAETGRQIQEVIAKQKAQSQMGFSFASFRRSLRGISTREIGKSTKKEEPASVPWVGLQTFMTEAEQEDLKRKEAEEAKRIAERKKQEVGPEYAIERNLLRTERLDVLYYVDVAGPTPSNPMSMVGTEETADVGNGDVAPEWGVDLSVHGGTLVYGPWADRQRAHLQRAFFPPAFVVASPTKKLQPGEPRLWTQFKLRVEFTEETQLRIPCREGSKNWMFDHLPDLGQQRRQGAQIGCRFSRNSTVHYMMSLVASHKGYPTTLRVELFRPAVDSSLNGESFLEANVCRINCCLPSPLNWKDPRQWDFNVTLQDPVIHLLRDHVTLLTDLGKDWSAGPPTELTHFIPMIYSIKFNLKNWKLYTVLNDHNIIDSLRDQDSNVLLLLDGSSLNCTVGIPASRYRPEATAIQFSVESTDKLRVHLTFPKWNTKAAHATSQLTDLGQVSSLRLDGVYRYHADVKDTFVDTLRLNIYGRTCSFKCFGWAIRHFMSLQANYFGSFTNFTLSSEARRKGDKLGDPIDKKYREGQTNLLEVLLEIQVSDATVALPEALLGYEQPDVGTSIPSSGIGSCALLAVSDVLLSLRLHDYSMEMITNFQTVSVAFMDQCPDELLWNAARSRRERRESLHISDLDISAHRLFGPRPHNATYICMWEIGVGEVEGVMSPTDIRMLLSALRSFQINFNDEANSPAAEFAIEAHPDVTFLKLHLRVFQLNIETNEAAIVLGLPQGFQISLNDMPTNDTGGLISVILPLGTLQCLLRASTDGLTWLEAGTTRVDFSLDFYSRPFGWQEKAKRQISFVQSQDISTHRVPFIYSDTQHYGMQNFRHGAVFLPHPHILETSRQDRSNTRLPRKTPSFDSGSEFTDHAIIAEEQLALSKPPSIRSRRLYQDSSEADDSDDRSSEPEPSLRKHIEDEWNDDYGWPYLSHHANVVKQFRLESEHGSKRPQFHLTKGSPEARTLRTSALPHNKLHSEPTVDDSPDQSGTYKEGSVLRATSSKGLDIVFSPILAHFVQIIAPVIYGATKSIELEMDDLIAQILHKDAIHSPSDAISLEVDVPWIRLRTVQSILSLQEYRALKEPFTDTKDPNVRLDPRIVSTLELRVDHPVASGVFGSAERPLTLGVHQAMFTLSTFNSHILADMHHKQADIESSVLEVTVADSNIIIGNTVQSHLGNVVMNIQADAPAPVLATLGVAEKVTTHIATTISHWSQFRSKYAQYVVWSALASIDEAESDPLSRVVTSYLVQSGRPSKLRGDVSWKILNHARQQLRHLLPEIRRHILQSADENAPDIPTVSREDVMSTITSSWKDWTTDLTEEEIEQLPLFRILSSTLPSTQPTSIMQPVSIRTGFFHFILEDATETSSEIRIGPFKIDVLERRPTITVYHSLFSAVSIAKSVNPPLLQQNIRHVGVVCDLGTFHIDLSPSLLPFAGRIIRAQQHLTPPPRSPTSPTFNRPPKLPLPPKVSTQLMVDLSLHFKDLAIISRTYNFAFELALSHPTLAVNFHSRLGSLYPRPFMQLATDTSANINCAWQSFRLRVTEMINDHSQSTLAEFAVEGLLANAAWYSRSREKPSTRVSLALHRVYFSVPRHIARLLQSVEVWWDGYFLKQVNPLLKLFTTFPSSRPSRKVVFKQQSGLTLEIQAHIAVTEIRLHAVLGVWLVWSIDNLGLVVDGNQSIGSANPQARLVLRIASQALGLETWQDPDDPKSLLEEHSFKFPFPPAQLSARLVGSTLQCRGTFELFEIVLNANAIDAFVRASRQLASSDLDRIFTVLRRNERSNIEMRTEAPSPINSKFNEVRLEAQFLLSGVRLVLEGESSLCFFDIKNVFGEGTGANTWGFKVSDVSFSLAPKGAASIKDFDRKYRLAYMVLDLEVTSSFSEELDAISLDISVDKVHAVLQAAALAVLGDLIDSYQAEVLRGREEVMRQRLLRRRRNRSTGTLPTRPRTDASRITWLDKRIIKVGISSIGAAIPLAIHPTETFLPSESTLVQAFLFSILSVQFETRFGAAGNATVVRFAMQFLDSFDQSTPSHFLSHNHHSRNQMIYPRLRAEIRSRATPNTSEWHINGHVSGFELDMDPNIASFTFSLLDVYRRGLSKIELLAEAVQSADVASPIHPKEEKPPFVSRGSINTRTTHVLTSLEFQSGRVRLHHDEKQSILRTKGAPLSTTVHTSDISEISADILLPVVTLWVEWRATPASLKGNSVSDESPSSLTFKSTIHSSKNTVPPTVLKFISQLLAKVEARLSKPSILVAAPPKEVEEIPDENEGYASKALQAMSITFSLRIDQSTLEFTCLPDVNVKGALHWESGGFIATASPGAKSISFIGSVENLTAHLKHGYLSEDCVEATLRDLGFSAALSTSRDAAGIGSSRASIVIETDLRATALFSRLQDILCFKAVWFDTISPLGNQAITPTSPLTAVSRDTASSIRRPSRRSWSTALLLKLRKVEAQADLGTSISITHLTLEPVVFRTLLTNQTSEVFFSVGSLEIVGEGLFSGRVSVPDFHFRTVRGREAAFYRSHTKDTLLHIELQSGSLQATVSYEGKVVFLYDSQPLRVLTLDDWSHCRQHDAEHKLFLHFNLIATGVNIVAVTTAPAIFVDMVQKIQALLHAQYEGAARESEAYRRTNGPKRALSDVAKSVIRSSDQDRGHPFTWVTVQNMQVRLGHLFIGIARDSLTDNEPWGGLAAANFDARLTRHVRGADDERRNEMSMSLGSLQLNRYTSQAMEGPVTADKWLHRHHSEKKEVLRVPTMTVDMRTREFVENGVPILAFDLQNDQRDKGSNHQLSIGTDLVLFDWVRDMYRLTVQHVQEMRDRQKARIPSTPAEEEKAKSEQLPQAFSLEPTARNAVVQPRSGPFERGGKQWRPESIKVVPPVIQQLGNFSPGVGFYNLVVQGNLDSALAIWVHELVTTPVSELNNVLLSLYTKQLQLDMHFPNEQ